MCCCGKPTVNGEGPVRMSPDLPFIHYEPRPPALQQGDVLLYDEPGRCGGLDCHSHHFRLVCHSSFVQLLVAHGGGEERFNLFPHKTAISAIFAALDSNGRYWLLHTIYSAHKDGKKDGTEVANAYWRQAAAEKRIKVRKRRSHDQVRVLVEPKVVTVSA
jgi:hypothetical protein